MLNEEYLKPLKITQTAFAAAIGVPHARLNEILNGKRGVTVDTALRLGRALNTTPVFWLNLQQAVDLYDASHLPKSRDIERITPIKRELQSA
jgi:addiction module HigA family antidote